MSQVFGGEGLVEPVDGGQVFFFQDRLRLRPDCRRRRLDRLHRPCEALVMIVDPVGDPISSVRQSVVAP